MVAFFVESDEKGRGESRSNSSVTFFSHGRVNQVSQHAAGDLIALRGDGVSLSKLLRENTLIHVNIRALLVAQRTTTPHDAPKRPKRPEAPEAPRNAPERPERHGVQAGRSAGTRAAPEQGCSEQTRQNSRQAEQWILPANHM